MSKKTVENVMWLISGSTVSDHDRRENWVMEPAMTDNILNEIKEKGYDVRKIAMDEDTITIAKIHREFDSSIEKCSYRNHTVKKFVNTLYAKQKDKQIQKSLSTSTISHLKYFTYALSKNKNDALGLRRNLTAISILEHLEYLETINCVIYHGAGFSKTLINI